MSASGARHPTRRTPGRDEHQLVRGAAGDLVHRATRGTRLFAPGAGAPTGPRRPGALPRAGTPGRDEHQLVRGAAGALVHRASRGTRLFAPGAGAPTLPRHTRATPPSTTHRITSPDVCPVSAPPYPRHTDPSSRR